MASQTNAKQDSGSRQKMEDGVWRKSSERSFQTWSDAPSETKERHLLSGPALAWVEGNMIAHPEEYSNAFRRYVMLSASRRANETALGREQVDADERKKEVRVRFMFFAAAGLALLHALSGDLKPAIENMINGAEQTKMAAMRARKQSSAGLQIEPPSDTKVVMETRRDPETGEAVITTISEPRPVKLAPPPERDLRGERERGARLVQRQASLATERASLGDKRSALQLAAEAVRQSETLAAGRKTPDEPTGASEALAALYRGLASATLKPAIEAQPSNAEASLPCGSRYIFKSMDRNLRILERDTGRQEAVQLQAPIEGRLMAVDPKCQLAAFAIEDYAIKLMSFAGGTGQRAVVLHGHASDILSIAISPDAAYVATGSLDSSLRVWDARNGRHLVTIAEHEGAVTGVRFGADGRTLLSWASDKSARVWAIPSGRKVAALDGHIASVADAEFSRDGRRIVSVSVDGLARVWNAATGALEATLLSERSSIALARFASDADRIGVVTQGGDLEMWSVTTASRLAVRRGVASDPPRELTFSPDGRWIVATTWTGSVVLLAADLAGEVVELNGSTIPARHAAIATDGRHVEAFGADGVMRKWPLYVGHGEAVNDAIRIAGACLSGAERDELGLGKAVPAWCAKQPAAPSP